MKRNSIFTIGAAVLLLAGCTADNEAGLPSGSVPVQLTVSQDVTGGFTRTTSDLHSAATGFAVDETMTVFMKNGSTTTGKVYKVSSASAGTATLAPNADNEKLYYPTSTSGSVQLYAVYPSGITSGGTHTVAYDQTGDANYRSSDLMYSAAKTVNLSNKGTQQALNSFQHKMVRLKLNIVKSSNVTSVTQVKMVNVKRKVTVSALSEAGMTVGAGISTGDSNGDNILIFSGTNNSTAQQTYYVVFPKQVASGNDWNGTNFITVTADGSSVNYQLTKEFTAGKQYELTLNINAAALGSTVSITGWTDTQSATVQPTVVEDFVVAVKAPSAAVAVDLGLPSGLKWANMNVGAVAVTDYGTYFAWGETIGYTVTGNTKTAASNNQKTTNHNWANYWWGSSSTTLTKYVPEAKAGTNGLNGFYDKKSQLDLANDAARVNWGGKWRMPTMADIQELIDNTDSEWTTEGSVAGYKYKKKGNNSVYIFLPAAGNRVNTSVSNQGSVGYYWSSSLNEGIPYETRYLYFDSRPNVTVGSDGRCWGFPIRAVCEE